MSVKKTIMDNSNPREVLQNPPQESVGVVEGVKTESCSILEETDHQSLHIENLSALDSAFDNIHGNTGSMDAIDKETCERYADIIIGQVTRNQRLINSLDAKISSITQISDSYRRAMKDEHKNLCVEQLLLLTRGVFSFLNHRFVPLYLTFISEVSETAEGRDFLHDFFRDHSFQYVSSGRGEKSFEAQIKDHLGFLASHYVDMKGDEYDMIKKIITRCGLENEDTEFSRDIERVIQFFQNAIKKLPTSIRQQFYYIQKQVESTLGELCLRNIISYIAESKENIFSMKHTTYSFLSVVSFASIYGKDDIIKTAIAQLPQMDLNTEQLQYMGVLLQETNYSAESLQILISYGNPKNPDVLESIARTGILNPDLIEGIQTEFARKIGSVESEPCTFLDFVSSLEEEVVSGERTDISLERAFQLSGLAHWMAGESCLRLSEGKDDNYLSRAGEYYAVAYKKIEEAYSILKYVYENPGVLKTKKDREIYSDSYKKILSDHGYFLMHHTTKHEEALQIFEYLLQEFNDDSHFNNMAQLALLSGNRIKAHEYITRFSEGGERGAEELWMNYYLSSSDIWSNMRAVKLLLDTDIETISFMNPEIVSNVQSFVEQLFSSLETNTQRDSQEDMHYLYLLRLYAMGFEISMDRAFQYWRMIAKYMGEGKIQALGEHYSAITHPDNYADINPNDTEERIKLYRIFVGLLEDAEFFCTKFSGSPVLEHLIEEIVVLFRDFPEGLGLGFVSLWEQKYINTVTLQMRKRYSPERIVETAYILQ